MKKTSCFTTDKETTIDLFNLQSYIKGLSRFVSKCQTPMTIAIQGSWGSGKSSMMGMIEEEIKADVKEDNAFFVHFNTWQYSQFSLGDNLPIVFLGGLIEKISEPDSNKYAKTIQKIAVETVKSLAKVTTSFIGGDYASDILGSLIDTTDKTLQQKNSEHKTVSKALEELKEGFSKLVTQKCKEENKDRIVFFIDDLDRLQPQKAVELMEILKIIIECEDCVLC